MRRGCCGDGQCPGCASLPDPAHGVTRLRPPDLDRRSVHSGFNTVHLRSLAGKRLPLDLDHYNRTECPARNASTKRRAGWQAMRKARVGRANSAGGGPVFLVPPLWTARSGAIDRLTAEDRTRLAAIATVVRFRKGETIYRQGEAAAAIFNIVTGMVKAYKSPPDGSHHIVEFLFQDDLIGLAADGEYVNSADALTAVTLYRIPVQPLEARLRTHSGLDFQVICKLCHELGEAQRHALSAQPASCLRQELSLFLQMLSGQQASQGETGDLFTANVPRSGTHWRLCRSFARGGEPIVTRTVGTRGHRLQRSPPCPGSRRSRVAGDRFRPDPFAKLSRRTVSIIPPAAAARRLRGRRDVLPPAPEVLRGPRLPALCRIARPIASRQPSGAPGGKPFQSRPPCAASPSATWPFLPPHVRAGAACVHERLRLGWRGRRERRFAAQRLDPDQEIG